jgi:hypothetical protein
MIKTWAMLIGVVVILVRKATIMARRFLFPPLTRREEKYHSTLKREATGKVAMKSQLIND